MLVLSMSCHTQATSVPPTFKRTKADFLCSDRPSKRFSKSSSPSSAVCFEGPHPMVKGFFCFVRVAQVGSKQKRGAFWWGDRCDDLAHGAERTSRSLSQPNNTTSKDKQNPSLENDFKSLLVGLDLDKPLLEKKPNPLVIER